MRLDAAIKETILRDAEVVAGRANLKREISWVHMVDRPDIVHWVKAGELLLTTSYDWPSDEIASRDLVRKLSSVGLAGVLLAAAHFRDRFPPEVVEEANRVGLPLLELPWKVPFSEVAHQVLAKIINFQRDGIEHSEQLHRALTNAAASAPSLPDIASVLTDLLDGKFSASASTLECAKVCGWSDSKPYRVCLILLDEPIPLTPEGLQRREHWVKTLRRQLRFREQPELIVTKLNQIKLMLSAESSPESLWDAISDRAAAMAVSRVHAGVKGMAMAAQDVDALMPTLRPGRLHQFDEILFPRALLGDANARDMLIERVIMPLTTKRRGQSMLETLNTLTNEGFQLSNTAKTLGIHISTLRCRAHRKPAERIA